MARARPIKTNFTSGEVDPLIQMRSDLQLFANGASKMRNAWPFPQGGFRRRDGLEFLTALPPESEVLPIAVVTGEIDNGGGASYVIGDVLTLQGGTFTEAATFKVLTVIAGTITSIQLLTSGDYTVAPASGTPLSGGGGTGATAMNVTTETQVVVQLIDFTFSINENYLLVFTVSRFYVFRKEDTGSGTNQLVDTTIHLYSNQQLLEFTWTQSLDVMLVFHGDVPIQIINRVTENNWTFSEFPLTNIPSFAFGVVQTETLSIPVGPTPKVGDVVTGTAGDPSFAAADVGKYIRVFGSPDIDGEDNSSFYRIVGFNSDVSVELEFLVLPLVTSSTTILVNGAEWLLEEIEWTQEKGFPRCGTFFQGRLCVAGSPSLPNNFWASRAGDINDFNKGGLADDLGIEVTADTGNLVNFQNIYPGRHLQIYGDSAEFYIPISEVDPITPENTALRRTTSVGSQIGIPVFEVDGVVYFVHRGGQSLNQFVFVDAEKAYSTDTISLASSHLVRNPEDAAFKKSIDTEDSNYIWVVNSDGTMAAFCLLRSEEVNAWSLHTTLGTFERTAVLDQTSYFHVNRILGGDPSISYTGDFFNIAGQDTSPRGLSFNNDGTKIFVVGQVTDTLYEYDLSIAYDLSAGGFYSGNSFFLGSQTLLPKSVFFNTDGTKFFIAGADNRTIFEYDLTTPFTLDSGVSFSGVSFSFSGEMTSISGTTFNPDGFQMYATGNFEDTVFEYTLTTAFDLTTASFSGNSFNVSAQDGAPLSITFSDDGAFMFMVGNITNDVFKYSLSPAFDIGGTVLFTGESFAFSPDDVAVADFIFNTDGSKAFAMGDSGNAVLQYDFTVNYSLNNIAFSGFKMSTAGQDSLMVGMGFNADGTKLVMLGDLTDEIYEYDLQTPFTPAEGVSFTGKSFAIAEDPSPHGFTFNDDGTKFFIVGTSTETIYEYFLSTPYDVSTAAATNSFSVISEETIPKAVAFNTDGTKMFIVGAANNTVFEYTLSVGFDLSSTVTFTGNSFSVATEETSCSALRFNPDGSRFFILGVNSDTLFEYELATNFSLLSGVTFSDNFFIIQEQEILPNDFVFNSDGTGLTLIGNSFSNLFGYVLVDPYTLNNASGGDYIEIFNRDLRFDSGVIATDLASPVSIVTGLSHLNGAEVGVIVDGIVHPNQIVFASQLTLPIEATESYQLGLAFPDIEDEDEGVNVVVRTLPADVLLPEGTAMGKKKRIPCATIRFVDSQGFYLQGIQVPFREMPENILDAPIPLQSGDIELQGLLGWNELGQIDITQIEPLAMTVLGLGYDLSV